jgi:hypothetical protein
MNSGPMLICSLFVRSPVPRSSSLLSSRCRVPAFRPARLAGPAPPVRRLAAIVRGNRHSSPPPKRCCNHPAAAIARTTTFIFPSGIHCSLSVVVCHDTPSAKSELPWLQRQRPGERRRLHWPRHTCRCIHALTENRRCPRLLLKVQKPARPLA